MREIKFRAWDRREELMFYSPMITSDDGADKAFTSFCAYIEDNTIYVEDFQIMQYTGLKDKNGKEIFENDILEHPEYGNCKVIYRYGGFGIEAKTSSWISTGFHSFSTRSADYEHYKQR